jgi:hypothetical protein
MRLSTVFVSILVVAVAAVPATAGLKVNVDHSVGYDFSTVQSFAWGEGGQLAANELNQQRIDDAIQDELRKKGYTWTEHTEPSLVVVTFAGANQKAKQSNVSVGIGVTQRTGRGAISVGGSRPVGGGTTTQGVLSIVLVDPRTGDLVWRADCTDTVSGDGNKMEKKIRKAVERAFQDFPPGQGEKK